MSEEESKDDFWDWLEETSQGIPKYFTVEYTEENLKKIPDLGDKVKFLKREISAFKKQNFELGITPKMIKKAMPKFYTWVLWCKETIKELELIDTESPKPGKLPTPEQPASEKLYHALDQYSFFELEAVKCLSEKNKLVSHLSSKKLPYQIAMLDYLGFIDHLFVEHCNSIKRKTATVLSEILGKNSRDIRGNIDSLSNFSGERNRSRYKPHMHKEAVKEYLLNLK